nr:MULTISPECIES: Mpo1-like protein [unclassified Acinetobacter]
MSKLETLLSQYAAYHLDHKNVLTHFVGIPLIVFSIMCLTARLGITVVGFEITMDDVIGLAIGPLFVLAELVFLMGFRKELEQRMLTQARKQRAEMDAKSLQSAHP